MIFKRTFSIIVLLMLLMASIVQSQDKLDIDSLKTELERLKFEKPESEELIEVLNWLAQQYMNKAPAKALNYAYEAIELSFKMENSEQIYEVYGTIGMIYQEQGFYDQAMEYFFKSLFFFEKMSDMSAFPWSYINIGNIYFAKNDLNKSREYYMKALKIFGDNDDPYGIATTYNNLGMIYTQTNECDSSLYFFNKALKIREELEVKSHLALSYRYIGNAYKMCGKYDESIEHLNKSLEMYREANDEEGVGQLLIFIGDFFLDYKEMDNSIESYKLAEEHYRFHKDNSGLAEALNRISEIQFKNGNFHECINNARKSLLISTNNGLLLQQRISYNNIYKSYAELDDFKNAFRYSELYFAIKDSISNESVEKRIAQLEFVMADRRYSKEIELLEKDKEIQALILKKRTNLIYYFIISSLVLLLLVVSNIRKFNYKVKLTKQFSFEASIMSKIGVVFLTGVYFTAFLFLFQPLGLSNLSPVIKMMVIAGFGIISMGVLFVNFVIFHVIEKLAKIERWDVVKYFIFILFIVFGISIAGWFYANGYDVKELAPLNFYDILIIVFSLTIFPVFLIILFIEKIYLNKHAQMAKVISHHLKHVEKPFEDHLIHIKSDKSKEEIQILLSQFICAEAKGNYSEIYYNQNKKLKKKMMLISMKVIEDQLVDYEKVMRCHKSYIVNLQKIDKVSGNSQGYKLHFKELDFKVPVSRNFPKSILNAIKEDN